METLNKTELSTKIIDKCNLAKSRIWISSPYIGGEASVFGILGSSFKINNLDLRLLVDISDDLNCDYGTLNSLLEYGFEIKSLTGLHAKIYIIDDETFLTSANLTGRAFTRKLEIGVFMESKESKEAIKIFEEYYRLGSRVSKFSYTQITKQKYRKKRTEDGREYGEDAKSFFTIPKPLNQKYILEKSKIAKEMHNYTDNNRVWKISLGHRWTEEYVYMTCIKNNTIAIGWFEEDIKKWDYKKIASELKKYYGEEKKQNANSIYNFVHTIKAGDIVMVYSDRENVRAIGLVISDYYFSKTSDNYMQCRDVIWFTYENNINIFKLNDSTFLSEITLYELYKVNHNKLRSLILSL